MAEQIDASRAKALRAIHAVYSDPERWKAETEAAAAAARPSRSLLSIYGILKKNPKTRYLLKRKRSAELMSYQAFHELVADGYGKGGKIGKLRL
jgi:enoyl-CoA hydratase/carnithine racemase